MNNTFETFKPNNPLIAKYVDYYYLDIKSQNTVTEFECFPHYYTTISLYKSNISPQKGEVIYDDNANFLEIFTPIRDTILKVKQMGKVHRIVIVFKPLGIQQFYKDLNFTDFIKNYSFFSSVELSALFETQNTSTLTTLLDVYLSTKFIAYKNHLLEESILLILKNAGTVPIEQIALEVGASRRHVNRLFNTHFGISVKTFNKIVLFRKTLEKKLFKNPKQSFTELAYEFNYSDQSHLNKVFQNLTSNSPRKFLKDGTLLGNEDTFWHLKK